MVKIVDELRSKIERYEQFLLQDPKNTNLVGQLADLYLQAGEIAQASNVIKNVLQSGIEDAGLQFKLSNIAIAANDPEEAESHLMSLRAKGTNNSAIEYNLAYVYMLQRRISEAETLLSPLVENNDSSTPDAKLLLARCYHHLGKLEEAISLGIEYAEIHPEHQEAHGVLALLNFDADHETEAKQYGEMALMRNPNNLEARLALGSLSLNVENIDKAKTHFTSALKSHPYSGRAWSGMGLVDMLNLDIDQAISSLNNAVEYMPNHIGTWHSLAWCHLIKGDLKIAKECFDSAMSIDHNFGETHGGLAVIAVLQNQIEEARKLTRKALMLNPLSFSGRFAESLIVGKTDPQAAQELVQEILQSKLGGDESTLQETLSNYARANKARKILH